MGAREWREISRKKKPKDMSECSCVDECPTSADGFARGSKEMGGEKGSVEISQGRCADECGEWTKGNGKKARWRAASVDARKSTNGKGKGCGEEISGQ